MLDLSNMGEAVGDRGPDCELKVVTGGAIAFWEIWSGYQTPFVAPGAQNKKRVYAL